MPKRGVKKINPKSMPQNIPLKAPALTRSDQLLVLGLFFPAGQKTMAASVQLDQVLLLKILDPAEGIICSLHSGKLENGLRSPS